MPALALLNTRFMSFYIHHLREIFYSVLLSFHLYSCGGEWTLFWDNPRGLTFVSWYDCPVHRDAGSLTDESRNAGHPAGLAPLLTEAKERTGSLWTLYGSWRSLREKTSQCRPLILSRILEVHQLERRRGGREGREKRRKGGRERETVSLIRPRALIVAIFCRIT